MGEQKKVLTEAMLRALCLPRGACVPVPEGTALTPLAREYAREHSLTITALPPGQAENGVKPEHMTHLNKSTLVPKTHPRIRLRGKLDSFEALLLQQMLRAMSSTLTSGSMFGAVAGSGIYQELFET